MKIFEKKALLKKWATILKSNSKTLGFVPTMGYLHEGHLSLARAAMKECDRVIVSVFVNPTQFEPDEDYSKYPRDFERDKKMLEELRVDAIFHPSVEELYSQDTQKFQQIPHLPRHLSNILCGHDRPHHFHGVAQAVNILFHIIQPDKAYFGQKDYQQTRAVDWLINTMKFSIGLRVMPTVREQNGLALSSRNLYLNSREKRLATLLYESLEYGKKLYKDDQKNPRLIEAKIKELIHQKLSTNQNTKMRLHYAEIRDAKDLSEITTIEKRSVILIAMTINGTRLIDNVLIG